VKKAQSEKFVSPSPSVFHRGNLITDGELNKPQALTREISTNAQKNWAEDTILYGEDDALPLRIAKAVQDSPATGSCLDTIAQFIKGSGFSNPDLMKLRVDEQGTTLWELHCMLADSMALFDGFSVNFKFALNGKITNAYRMSFESVRFVKPVGDSKEITMVKYNPYFGTDQHQHIHTKAYPLFDPKAVLNQIQNDKKGFPGQVFYYGKTHALYKFYPVPRYWRAKKWIYVDGKIQEFHSENLDNGFFQSVLMNVIGDPNALSKNPKYQTEYEEDGVKKIRPGNTTVGQEFNEQMRESFSGSKKAGSVMVLWSNNKDQSVNVQPFPNNTNSDLFNALQDLTTKNITIGTRVPSILANISEGVSLGSNGGEMQKAVELMQSRVIEEQQKLMQFYNEILLPNMDKATKDKVEIVNFNPITNKVEIPDNVWEFLNDEEKVEFIKMNMSNVKIIRTAAVATPDPANPEAPLPDGTVPPPAPQVNTALKDIGMEQLNKIQKIVARYNLGTTEPTNPKALTYEQAKQFLLSYGLTETDLSHWLIKPEDL
jgi:hypothetical protein